MRITADKDDMQRKLWDAAARGDTPAVRMLVMAGIDIDARNGDGFTAFNLATMNGHHDTALTILAGREFRYAQALENAMQDSLSPAETPAAKPARKRAKRG
jgi:hypothetical protein